MPALPTSPPPSLDDLQELLQMYNDVTRRLEVSHERLQAEVTRLNEQLEQKNKELEMKKRLAALGEMAAGIAHEIRNPLGGIQLYASTLAAEVADKPAALALVQKISSGVKGLNALVTDMLTFTQNITLNKRNEHLADIIGSAIELSTPTLLAHNIDVVLPEDLESFSVHADVQLLRQVILNLLLNAAEAIGEKKPPAGSDKTEIITVGVQKLSGDHDLLITISDTGPGIPPDALDKLFNPFFTTKHTGTGLGLAIVHRIIEAHGGTITAENSAQGGAIFKITI